MRAGLCIALRVFFLLLHICGRLLFGVEVRHALAGLLVMPPPSRERELEQCFAACETLHSLLRHQRCYLTLEETCHARLDERMLTSPQPIGYSPHVFLPTQHPLSLLSSQISTSAYAMKIR